MKTVSQTNRDALYEVVKLLGDGYSSGYLGNYERWGDETTHYIWYDYTNSNGLHETKSYGGYSGEDSHRLLMTAIELLKKQRENVRQSDNNE